MIVVLTVCGGISAGISAAGAQAVSAFSARAIAGQVPFGQETTMQGGDVRHGPLSAEDQALVKRWAELFAAVLGEFRDDHRDPTANVEGDFSTREIRIRRLTGDGWVDRTLTKQELATADLRALAKRLYQDSKGKGKTG